MTVEQKILIENILCNAISGFHEISDKKQREKTIKDFTLNFCKEQNLDPIQAIDYLKEIIKGREMVESRKFDHYKGNSLNKIILGSKKTSKKEAPEDINFE